MIIIWHFLISYQHRIRSQRLVYYNFVCALGENALQRELFVLVPNQMPSLSIYLLNAAELADNRRFFNFFRFKKVRLKGIKSPNILLCIVCLGAQLSSGSSAGPSAEKSGFRSPPGQTFVSRFLLDL